MKSPRGNSPLGASLERHYVIAIIIAIAAIVLVITWVGISQSRHDSFQLLVRQGAAFTTALSEASQNAIDAERFYDRLLQRRYADIVTTLVRARRLESDTALARFVTEHDLYGVWLFERNNTTELNALRAYTRIVLPEFVRSEADSLAASTTPQFTQLLDEQDETGDVVLYYLQLTDDLSRVAIIAADGRPYQNALRQTGIGYLSQRMAREEGVEYIIYQSTEGIIFASRKPGPLLAIESDPFLQTALTTDTTSSRIFDFQGEEVLELVHPFSTVEYPQGVFRVGLSLRGFRAVSRGFDLQMILLSAVLCGLVITALLYLNSRRKRRELSQEYSHIKSLTDRIFEQMQTGVAVVNHEGRIQFTNQAFETAVGLRDLVGQTWHHSIGTIDQTLAATITSSRPNGEAEITLQTTKQPRTLLVAWSQLHFPDRGTSSVVLVAYDITKMRQYELEAARRERLSEMGNLAAGVAHEIRNPLNTISIAAQRLASEFSPSERHEEFTQFTQSIRTETKRLNDIITRFLALAREEKKRRTRVALKRLVDETLVLLTVEASRLGIQISHQIPPDIEIESDPDELKQIFTNLFNNAKEAAAGEPIQISIQAKKQGSEVVITFADNGPGIPEALRTKIFTPFFTTKESGTGLGLPIIHKIIAEMGGSITVTEAPGGGALFTITLPLSA